MGDEVIVWPIEVTCPTCGREKGWECVSVGVTASEYVKAGEYHDLRVNRAEAETLWQTETLEMEEIRRLRWQLQREQEG